MHLSPMEQEKLLIYVAGQVASQRLQRGLLLNYPEAIAYITAELLERIRDGNSIVQLMEMGTKILTCDQVMEGIPDMIEEIQVEGTFPDGTKLVTIHRPIRLVGRSVL